MVKAPHLPPATCSLRSHEQRQLLPWVFFILGIAVLTSLAVSLYTISVFYPGSSSDGGVVSSSRSHRSGLPDATVIRSLNERRVTIYTAAKKIGDSFYPADAHVTDGLFLSSDGWAVLPPGITLRATSAKEWVAIDGQGVSHRVLRVLPDPVSGLVYIKVEGDGYRIMDVEHWESGLPKETSVWSYGGGEWFSLDLEKNETAYSRGSFALSLPLFTQNVVGERGESHILVNDNGQLFGCIGKGGEVVPGWLVEKQLSTLLSTQSLAYYGLPLRGSIVTQVVKSDGENKIGVVLDEVGSGILRTLLAPRDIIVAINGARIEKESLAYQILGGEVGTVDVTRIRNGVEETVSVPRVLLP